MWGDGPKPSGFSDQTEAPWFWHGTCCMLSVRIREFSFKLFKNHRVFVEIFSQRNNVSQILVRDLSFSHFESRGTPCFREKKVSPFRSSFKALAWKVAGDMQSLKESIFFNSVNVYEASTLLWSIFFPVRFRWNQNFQLIQDNPAISFDIGAFLYFWNV